MNNQNEPDIAPVGTVWVCGACGKRASSRMNGGISYGWDESCYLHAALCEANPKIVDGKPEWVAILDLDDFQCRHQIPKEQQPK